MSATEREKHLSRIMGWVRRWTRDERVAQRVARETLKRAEALGDLFLGGEAAFALEVLSQHAYEDHVVQAVLHPEQPARALNPAYQGPDPVARRFALIEVD